MNQQNIKENIFHLIKKYYSLEFKHKPFIPGETRVPVSGKVFDEKELQFMVDAVLDGWFTSGRYNDIFEKKLKEFIGVKHLLTVNSGSSANLVAFASLTVDEWGDRAIRPGDEVITTATSFPTTVNPILLYQAIPVFVDMHLPTYNVNPKKIENAITEKTKAIVMAHTLGNPFDLDRVRHLADKYNLWLIEDCCDALGATFRNQHVGTFGDIGTVSFYPAHHITMGEGGAVFTNNSKLKKIMESVRDWGRDCWCIPGKDNTCGKRFEWQLGGLPQGYDHKYIYSRLGYNLKITDMQAALGLAQLDKLDEFIRIRRYNFTRLKEGLRGLDDRIVLPEFLDHANPSWFGFLITLKDNRVKRNVIIDRLTQKKIDTRLLFAGDLTKQPYLKNESYRICGDLENTDRVLHDTFWVGVTPMIDDAMLDYMIQTIRECFN